MAKPPLVLLHGLYLNALSWEPWLERARAAGFDARAVEWPLHEGDPAARRARPPAGLGSQRFADVTEPVLADIRDRGDNPVLIGHSIGALQVQRLLSLGVGRAGVAITPAPPRGILSLSPHFLRANLPHVNALAGNRVLRMSPRRFHYTFATTDTRADSDAAWERWCGPESRNIPLSTQGRQGRVDFAAVTQPLLVYGAEHDRLIPESLARRIARAYQKAGAPAEYRRIPGRSHLVCNQEGWESLADEVFAWASGQA